jgi:hypothetical protein
MQHQIQRSVSAQASSNDVSRSPLQQLTSGVFRSPRRISITLPFGAYQRLLDRSDFEGRSLSNLAAFLLETAVADPAAGPLPGGR